MRLTPAFSASVMFVAVALACRSNDVCGIAACAGTLTPGGAGASTGVRAGAAGEPPSPIDAGGASGIAGAEVGGAAGESSQPPGLTCDEGLADCDGSRFTGCETDLSWTQRHCGACGNVCEGGCAFDACLPTKLVTEDVEATTLVSTKSHAYATLKRNDCFVARIDLESGELESVLESLDSETRLAVSRDRVYVFDEANERLYTIPFGANQVATPEDVLRPSSMGANQSGAYYVRGADEEAQEPVDELWFRLNAADPWQLATTAPHLAILSSSPSGVVLEAEQPDGASHLFRLDGATLVDHGPAPEGLDQAVAIEGGIVALGYGDVSARSLHWLKPDAETRQYALEGTVVDYGTVLFASGGDVGVLFEDRHRTYLQFFREARPLRNKLGLASYTSIAALDDAYVWHTTYDSWITMRVLRSTWQSFEDF